jgi:hypothetical protein
VGLLVAVSWRQDGGRRAALADLGAFHLQPSELIQLLTIIALGKYLNDRRRWRGAPGAIWPSRWYRGLPVLLMAKHPTSAPRSGALPLLPS